MKQKLLLLTAALLCSVGSWADYTTSDLTTAGWTKITSINQNDIKDNYYIFLSEDETLILTLEASSNQGNNAMFYRALATPTADEAMIWTLEANGSDYAMRNLKTTKLQMQTEYSASSNDLRWRTNDQWWSCVWTGLGLAYANSYWTLTSTTYSRPIGIYNNVTGTPVAGNELGANDTGKGQNFNIYAISRADFANAYASTATSSSPVNVTGYISNPNIWQGTNKEVMPEGWTEDTSIRSAGNNNRTANVSAMTYLEGWTANPNENSLKVKYYQDITSKPNGKDSLKAFAGDDTGTGGGKIYISNGATTVEASMPTAEADIETSQILVTNKSFTIGMTAGGKNAWVHAMRFRLYYYGNAISYYSPAAFTSPSSAAADTWYAFDVASDGVYRISSSATATIRYTQDNSQDADTGGETVALAAGGYTVLNLSAGTFYFKSDATGDVTIEALSATNGTDVTGLFITNPSFETGDFTSWSNLNDVMSVVNNNDLSGKSGTYYVYSHSNRSKKVAQTISGLPAGHYLLGLYARAKDKTPQLNFGGNNTPIRSGVDATTYYVAYDAAENASAEISFSAGGGYDYLYFDNFTLTYYSTLPDVSISDLTSEPMDGAVRAALTSASSTYSGSKTAANYNALQTAIINAKVSIAEFAAKTGADADWTGIIHNPSFELGGTVSTSPGWSLNGGNSDSTNGNDAMKSGQLVEGGGSYIMNYWTNSTNGSKVYQTINNLPAGTYKLSAYVLTAAGTPLTLKAGDVTNTAVAPDGGAFKMETYFTLASKQNIEIAVGTTQTSAAWYNIDHIQLFANPTMPSVTAVEGTMNSTVASTQTSAISTYEDSQTVANLNAALNAIAAAKRSIYYYSEALGILNAASELDADGQASYAADATVADIQSAYDGRTLTSVSSAQKTSCSAAYITAVKAQTTEGSDMTEAITNPSFETKDFTGWTNSGMQTQTNMSFDRTDGKIYVEKWHDAGAKSVKQTLVGFHSGLYKLRVASYATGATDSKVYVKVGDTETPVAVSASADYEIDFSYDGTSTLEIGFSSTLGSEGWICVDNFRLTYMYSSLPASLSCVEGNMNATVRSNMQAAVEAYNNGNTFENYLAAQERITIAETSKASYAEADLEAYKARMAELLATTNVYTTEAYNKWYANVDANYAAGVYTDDEVVLLTATGACQGATESAHKIANHIDEVLLSNWKIGGEACENYKTNLYINTWSLEGNSDGSGFQTPFFEYWVSDANSLGATTLVSEMTGLEANTDYSLDIWARVRQKDGESAKVAGSITVQLGSGSAVDLTDGTQVGSSKFYINHFKAYGTSDASGNLTITITVAENSNISWLSFKDLMLKPKATVTVKANAGKYGTVIFPFTPDISSGFEGIKFYSCSDVVNDYVQITEVATPEANTPYIIKNTTGSNFNTTISDWDVASNASYTVGLLTGSCSSLYVNASDASYDRYVLQTLNGKQAFYYVNEDFTLPAYKCYLTIPTGASVKAFFFPDDTTPTAINGIEDENDENSTIYNLAGQRMNKLQRGVNIVNGKKVLVK